MPLVSGDWLLAAFSFWPQIQVKFLQAVVLSKFMKSACQSQKQATSDQ
jgi:hypothetical protein